MDAKKRIIEVPHGVTFFSEDDVWLYQAVMDNRLCLICRTAETIDVFRGNNLRMNFPYLEILDVNTIKTHTHMPRDDNCRCYLIRSLEGYERVTPKGT